MDIISLLENDHRVVEELFAQYEAGTHGVVIEIAKELTLHTKIEEKVLYPAVRQHMTNGQEEAEHAKREHDKVDEFLAELEQNPDDADAFEDLKAEVEHHVQEEEADMFPKMRDACPQEELDAMGQKAEEMKASG